MTEPQVTDLYETFRADPLTRRQLARVIVASGIGSVIEWYDFLIYGTAVALYIGPTFFPAKDPLASTLAGFATFFVGFVGRPIGAALFGHYGDRIGRKATLVFTLVIMGLTTALIGLLPGYAQIGIAGGIFLVLLRCVQGIALGGEWAGAVLLTMEWGPKERKGLLAAVPQAGIGIGLALGLLMLQQSALLGVPHYWVWRVPFLASMLLVFVGLYVRLGILETPVFTRLLEERLIEPRPLVTLARTSWREVVSVWLARTSQLVAFYIFTNFVLTYGVKFLHFKQSEVYFWVLVVSLFQTLDVLFWGWMSDRVGRKRLIGAGMLALAVFTIPYFVLMDSRVAALAFVAILVSYIVLDIQYSPFAALVAESFTGRIRYSGASLGYHLGSLTGGGAPIIALALLQATGTSMSIALFMVGTAALSIVALSFVRDRTGQSMVVEYDRVPETLLPAIPRVGRVARM
jgi:MFS family permease